MDARTSRRVMAVLLVMAAGRGLLYGAAAEPPTRDTLEEARRRVVALESELALASTRKPYLVLDLHAKTLRYRLMGMTLRELPLPGLHVKGLIPAPGGKDPDPSTVAGIFTVREKDDDPRLDPLTPEQVEAGADDENTANILPPEPPKSYRVKFKQPVVLRVNEQTTGSILREGWEAVRAFWDRLRGARTEEKTRIEFVVGLDATTGAEVYRSLIPDLRWLVLAPPGFSLPPAGQEAPPKPRAPRAAPKPPPKPLEPPGVPFQIPSPVEEGGAPPQVPPPFQEPEPAPEAPLPEAPGESPAEGSGPEEPDPEPPGADPGAPGPGQPPAAGA